MVTENCKKIKPVVVKLCSKTNIPLFLNTVYKTRGDSDEIWCIVFLSKFAAKPCKRFHTAPK